MVKLNRLIFLLYFLLLAFGLLYVASSSVVEAYRATGNQWQYVLKQLTWLIISLFAYLVVSHTSPKMIFYYSSTFYFFSFLLLVVVLFAPAISGAKRWLDLGFFSLQPSEFIKTALLIYLPYLHFQAKISWDKFLIYGLVPVILILIQPDFGTASVIIILTLLLYFLLGFSIKNLVKILPLIIPLIFFYVISAPYRMERLKTFFIATHDPQGSSYQSRQSLIGIGSGGFWGLGIGQSRQKYNFLPESSTDSIFSIIAEETGTIGSSLLLFIYFMLIIVIFRISANLSTPLHAIVVAGIGSLISIQSLINLSALTGLLPLTGVPLPFVSYGGSSLLNFSLSLGVISSLVKHDH